MIINGHDVLLTAARSHEGSIGLVQQDMLDSIKGLIS